MYSYREQLLTISKIKLLEGDRKTLDCPFCGGRKKFTIERQIDGKLLWNCFRASCSAKGVNQGMRSVASAKAYIVGGRNAKRLLPGIPLPSFTTRIENRLEAGQYLRSVNSYPAYEDGLISIKYDPKSDRVIFYNPQKTGAVGRALSVGPKWLTYGDTSGGIHVGAGPTAVLVEDVASACAISRVKEFTGVALLGINITSVIKNSLQLYQKVYIVLDSDASKKALMLTKQIRRSIFLRVTDRDPKELSEEQIVELLI